MEVFWKHWIKSNELERRSLTKELTGVSEHTATIINSYFVDLYEYLKEKPKRRILKLKGLEINTREKEQKD